MLVEINEKLNRIEKLLFSIKSSNKEIMDVKEAAEYCGLKVSYVYKLCSSREIPHYKNSGKMLRFKKEGLSKWLLRNKVKPNI
ncbi:MAG: helix-turn-helix domain-containing protein [Crocinitomicaceae bacterium]|nr:helix-turn-helix domain-containing protein [Crocinitomicaceae bacterium]